MYFEELMDNYQTYLLVFARVMGIFVYNPIFARKNIPSYVKIGASIGLTLVIASNLTGSYHVDYDSLTLLAIAFVREGIIGFILGFLTQMFLSALVFGGEMMDNQSGLGMAKIYDAGSGIQMPIFGTITTYMFLIYFFVTNCHLTYIKIFAISYDFIPIEYGKLNPQIFMVIVEYFGQVLTLAIKLALPLIVAELILEFSMGILMKAVPQVQVMQVNIQLKLIYGLFILLVIANPMSDFIEKYMRIMIDSLTGVLPMIAG